MGVEKFSANISVGSAEEQEDIIIHKENIVFLRTGVVEETKKTFNRHSQ